MLSSVKTHSPPPGGIDMLDLAPAKSRQHITHLAHNGRELTLGWDDGHQSRFHALWLRDNCACPQCRHPQALERTHMFLDHGAPRIISAQCSDGLSLELQFAAGDVRHSSRFSAGWLRDHCYAATSRAARQPVMQLWDAGLNAALPVVDCSDYFNTERGLRAWLDALGHHGIVLLRGLPQVPGKLLDVARHIGPVRQTNFGDHYDVVSMPQPNAVAYTSMGLELHTDLANWRFPPDYQLLFCLKNSVSGGGSIFADGFRVAEDLRRDDPQAFALLSTQPLGFRFHDSSCDIATRAPAIALDAEGRITRIRFNNWLRGAMDLPEDLIEPMYAALGTLWQRLRDPRYLLTLRLQPGELITYNNNRVLHGRNSFDANSGERHLQGCYLNQEDVASRLCLLERASAA